MKRPLACASGLLLAWLLLGGNVQQVVNSVAVSTGITGLGTGIATALGVNVGTTGSVLVKGTSVCADLSNGTTNCSAAVGQLPGTTTNDSAATGKVGEFITSGNCFTSSTTSTVTITIATPTVITWNAHGMTGACPVTFTTSSALPTGITSGTAYWVVPSSVTANTFQIATSIANALAGTSVNTSGSQSGTQTGTGGRSISNATAADVTGVSLTAGDWDCRGTASINPAGSTTQSLIAAWVSTTSATLPAALSLGGINLLQAAFPAGTGQVFPVGKIQVLISATTTVYTSVESVFAVSTNTATGYIGCRRMR